VDNEMKLADFQVALPPTSSQQVDDSISHAGSETMNHGDEEKVEETSVLDESRKYVDPSTVKSDGSLLSEGKGTVLSSSSKQWKRVRQVGRQAFLYVGAYVVVFSWTFAVHYLKALKFDSSKVFFPLIVLQAIFGGSLGLIIALIYFLPKIKQTRIKYEYGPWWWILKQAITGDAERVERFSIISNVSSIKSGLGGESNGRFTSSSNPTLSSSSRGRNMMGTASKRVSWIGEATIESKPPLAIFRKNTDVPNAINLGLSSSSAANTMDSNNTGKNKKLPCLPMTSDDDDGLIEEGREQEGEGQMVIVRDDEYETTETDLDPEHSGEQKLLTNIE